MSPNLDILGSEQGDVVNLKMSLTTDDKDQVSANMVLNNINSSDNTVSMKTLGKQGDQTEKEYSLEVVELSEDVVKAKLVDKKTGEDILIDSSQMQATIIPVIVALIVRAGLQYAIKHYGKKLAMQALIDLGVSQITKAYGGSAKNAKNGKGKVITIPNKKQTIVVRLMEAGSGGRKDAYWKLSVGNKSVNRAGNYSSNANETHITLQESSIASILNIIKKYKK